MAAPALEGKAETGFSFGGSAGPFTLTLPAAPADGDLLVLLCSSEAGGSRYPGAAWNTGWAELYHADDDDGHATILWKRAGASEPAAQDFYLGQNYGSGEAILLHYSGAEDPLTPSANVGASAYNAGTVTTPGITVENADGLVLSAVFAENPEGGVVSPPSGYVHEEGASNTGSVNVATATPGAGATGDLDWTGFADWWSTAIGVQGVTLEIPPAAGAGTFTGSAPLSAPAASASASATSTPPAFAGSAPLLAPAAELDAAASASPPGSGASAPLEAPAAELAGAASSTPPTFSGDGDLSAPSPAVQASASAAVPVFAASASIVAPAAVFRGVEAYRRVPGDLDPTIGARPGLWIAPHPDLEIGARPTIGEG